MNPRKTSSNVHHAITDLIGNQIAQKFLSYVNVLLFFVVATAHAETITTAVSANFILPLQEIVPLFEQKSGHKIRLVVGSTGKLYAQIKQGAVFDVLLSADDEIPHRLAKENLALANTQFTYAIGRLVLWSNQADFVQDNSQILHLNTFTKLSLANPKISPYGRAVIEVLTNLNLLEKLKPKFVQAEDITQAYQFIKTQNAQLGFVSLSQIAKNSDGSRWLVPHSLHAPIRQDAILLNSAQPSAIVLLNYLQSDTAKKIIRSYGYDVP